MPQKRVEIEGLGDVLLVKRRGAKSMRLTISADNTIRLALPTWVPYQAGVAFVNSRRDWIAEHRTAVTILREGNLIGKAHRLHFEVKAGVETPKTRVNPTEIRITHRPTQASSSKTVQAAVKKAGLRALKQECEQVMPRRLRELATELGYSYNSLDFKQLKARWGSCNHQKDITLNIFLMMLPWRLIEYVMVHELVHTVVLHHGPDFWRQFGHSMPDAKKRRKELKAYTPYF